MKECLKKNRLGYKISKENGPGYERMPGVCEVECMRYDADPVVAGRGDSIINK